MRAILAATVLVGLACGGNKTTTLARGEDRPVALAADATNLYWLASTAAGAASGAVRTMPLGGGAPATVASGFDGPRALAVSNGTLFWAAADGAIRSVPAAGGAVVTLATEPAGSTPFAVAAVGGTVYWLANTPATEGPAPSAAKAVLASVPAGGGARTVVAELPGWLAEEAHASLLTDDGDSPIWAQSDGTIRYLEAGQRKTIAQNQKGIAGIAIIRGSVYSVQNGQEAVIATRKALGTLDPTEVIAAITPAVVSVAADQGAFYAVSETSVAVTRVGTDKSVETLLSDGAGAAAAVATAGAVFVAMRDGRIVKVER